MPSPRLRRVPRDELPDDIGQAHDQSMALRGDATFFEVFGNHPDLYRWYTQSFYGEVFRGGLVDRRIKELVRFKLSTVHGCRFCNQGNRQDALDVGLSNADLDAVDDYENSDLSDAEKAALRLADRMVLTNLAGELDQQLHAELAPHFSDAEILELGLLLGMLSGVAKFLFAFDLVEREASCPLFDGD